jgi:preprotein translocase subunit SecF
MYRIIQKRNYFLTFSITLIVLSIIAIFTWGLKLGIDFTGGSLLEVKYNGPVLAVSDVQTGLESLNLGSLTVQPVGTNDMVLRFQDTSQAKHEAVMKELDQLATKKSADGKTAGTVEELRYDSVGPTVGQELKSKSVTAIFLVNIAILLYVAWAFRKVSKPIASWKYGLSAVIALFHDCIITIGFFAVFCKFFNMEVNTPFVAAILTVLGYSVNDTIVVFDRIRENLPKSIEDFENTVNISLNQTVTRSINTSFTVLLTLLSILIFGGSTIKDFALTLFVGVIFGTYSSVFIAPPILVIWEKAIKRK